MSLGKLTSLTMIRAIFCVREIIVGANLVQLVLNVLNNARCTILDKVVHHIQRFEDATVLFRLRLEFGPQVLHDHVVVLPVVSVVGQHLQLRVGDVPVLVGSRLFQDLLVFLRGEHRLLLASKE
mgnify:CR=1 FL=1